MAQGIQPEFYNKYKQNVTFKSYESLFYTPETYSIMHQLTTPWRRQWHTTPVLLPGKPHEQRSLVGCSPWGRRESDTTERLPFHFSLSYIGEGNGNPLQCSCLENPRDRGAWWAAVHGVAQSWTRLKQLSSSRQHIKKQRRYSANKGPSSQGLVFPLVMYGCESWTRKKAKCQRFDAFELQCWRGLLRVPQTARGSNQSILKKINPDYSLEGLMLKVKLQYLAT